MKKIGKDSKYGVGIVASFLKYSTILWVFFAILGTKVAFGSGIEVTLSADESSISLGEEFAIQVRIEGAQNIESLRVENSDKFSVSNQRESSSYQIINGKVSASKIFNYSLYSKKEGSFSCLLYTSPSPRDRQKSRMPSSA